MRRDTVGGIYAIVNIINGKAYVGSAVDIRRRWKRHRDDLSSGKHHSVKLQRSWNKNGKDNFVFKILELVVESDLISREQEWISQLDSFSNGYNSRPIAGSNLGFKQSPETIEKRVSKLRGRRRSAETIEKVRIANILHFASPQGKARREKISATNRGKILSKSARAAVAKANSLRVYTDEQRAQRSRNAKGRKISDETRAKMSLAKKNQSEYTRALISASRAGKTLSSETKKKISLSQKAVWLRRRAPNETNV